MVDFAGARRQRLLAPLLAACLWIFVLVTFAGPATTRAWAQVNDQEEPKVENQEPAGEVTAAKTQNLFTHIIESAGWFFGPLLFLISIGLVTLIVLLAMDLRMSASIPPGFVDEFADLVNKRQFKQAFDLCRGDNSFLARVLSAGMGRLQYGIEDAREISQHTAESVRAGKETLNTYLATIGTLGPMIGLVGTVFGMIQAFMELSAGGTPRPEKLAAGISHALVVTLLGIGLAVPAIFCHAFFKNRLTRITMETLTLSDDLLTQMYHNYRKASPGVPEARPATAPPA